MCMNEGSNKFYVMGEGSNKFYVMGVWKYMPKNYKNLNPKVSKTLNHSFSIKLKRNSMYKWNLLSINSVLCEWRDEKWIISVKIMFYMVKLAK